MPSIATAGVFVARAASGCFGSAASGWNGKRLAFTKAYDENRWSHEGRVQVEHHFDHGNNEAWSRYKIIRRDEAAHMKRARLLEQLAIIAKEEAG